MPNQKKSFVLKNGLYCTTQVPLCAMTIYACNSAVLLELPMSTESKELYSSRRVTYLLMTVRNAVKLKR